MSIVQTISLRSLDPVAEALHIREALKSHSVVHIQPGWHIADLRSFYDTLTDQLGGIVAIGEDFTQGGIKTGEKWLEIRYDADIPDMAAFRHSKNAQPLHTDESYICDPADIMFFYCVNRAPDGGATVFVDAADIVARLQAEDPELLAELHDTDVTYRKADQTRRQPIIGRAMVTTFSISTTTAWTPPNPSTPNSSTSASMSSCNRGSSAAMSSKKCCSRRARPSRGGTPRCCMAAAALRRRRRTTVSSGRPASAPRDPLRSSKSQLSNLLGAVANRVLPANGWLVGIGAERPAAVRGVACLATFQSGQFQFESGSSLQRRLIAAADPAGRFRAQTAGDVESECPARQLLG
ncbi:MAG: TauD/TfdA family dioxygenase [Planctomycetales bacterium]|nr:TauD/TfdA family dioxygenase [Planctomycetales bacterium]